ncbi:MAG: gas vesicle protein GvpO [Candidatus Nanopelagicales bacterium]
MTSMMDAIKRARTELGSITGGDVERVCGMERSEEGWQMQLEMVEIHRTPNTQDLLAVYDVELDDDGGVMGFDRVAHRVRGAAVPDEG